MSLQQICIRLADEQSLNGEIHVSRLSSPSLSPSAIFLRAAKREILFSLSSSFSPCLSLHTYLAYCYSLHGFGWTLIHGDAIISTVGIFFEEGFKFHMTFKARPYQQNKILWETHTKKDAYLKLIFQTCSHILLGKDRLIFRLEAGQTPTVTFYASTEKYGQDKTFSKS